MRRAGLTLDAGALLAVERRSGRMRALLARAIAAEVQIVVPTGVLAQSWRGGPRAAPLARLLQDPQVLVVVLDEHEARLVGELAGATGAADVIDLHVALTARRHGHPVVTSDPDDLARIDPTLELIVI